ncbi:MAG: hypothetical protein R3B89_21305 [Polyangiaceae bacterium]
MADQPEQSPSSSQRSKAHGLVLEYRDALGLNRAFISARIAIRVVRGTAVTPVPNSALGMALIDGQVVPVVALGEGTSQLVLCELSEESTPGVDPAATKGATETVAVSGVSVLESGAFPRLDAMSVEFRGEAVQALDLGLVLQALE